MSVSAWRCRIATTTAPSTAAAITTTTAIHEVDEAKNDVSVLIILDYSPRGVQPQLRKRTSEAEAGDDVTEIAVAAPDADLKPTTIVLGT